MKLIQIDHHPSRRQLNVFGAIWLVFFSVIGGIVLHKSGSTTAATVVWTFAVVVPVIGWLVPAVMRIVYIGMAYAAYPIGFVISHLILVFVYYVVLTPIGVVMRWFGYDPMCRKLDKDVESYWCEREQDDSLPSYFRQF